MQISFAAVCALGYLVNVAAPSGARACKAFPLELRADLVHHPRVCQDRDAMGVDYLVVFRVGLVLLRLGPSNLLALWSSVAGLIPLIWDHFVGRSGDRVVCMHARASQTCHCPSGLWILCDVAASVSTTAIRPVSPLQRLLLGADAIYPYGTRHPKWRIKF